MALIVKAYFTEGNNPEIIKRFTVDADVTTSYEYLRTKIVQAFPNLNQRNFSTFWRDGENDDIIFSSDDELLEALSQVSDGVLKIYIKIHPRTGPGHPPFMPLFHGGFPFGPSGTPFKHPPGTQPEFPFTHPTTSDVHPGVTCDGCEGAVSGPRFKCTQCSDYDLCVTCKQKGLHNEHKFVEIVSPVNRFKDMFQQFGFKVNAEAKNKDDGQPESNINFEDHLKNVGKCVEAMLQPLGINFNIDVSTSPKSEGEVKVDANASSCAYRSRCNGAKSSEKMASCNKNVQGCVANNEGLNGKIPSCRTKTCENVATKNGGFTTRFDCNDVEMVDAEKPSADVSKINKCRQSECKLASKPNEGIAKPASATTSVDQTAAANQTAATNQASAANSVTADSSWVDVDKNMLSGEGHTLGLEKSISDSIFKLKSMGYNDEGGWLTALVAATKGDVNKALDLIHAKH